MPLFFIGYDLTGEPRVYEPLWTELLRLGAKRLLKSEWALRSDNTLEQVFAHIQQYVDSNDALLVTLVDRARGIHTITGLGDV